MAIRGRPSNLWLSFSPEVPVVPVEESTALPGVSRAKLGNGKSGEVLSHPPRDKVSRMRLIVRRIDDETFLRGAVFRGSQQGWEVLFTIRVDTLLTTCSSTVHCTG